jgi:hypothetical protein
LFPPIAAVETLRVLQPGGVMVSSYIIKSPWVDILHLITTVRPDLQIRSGYGEFDKLGVIEKPFEDAGFKDYEQVQIPVLIVYEDAEELVDFLIKSI